ncbi:MAG: outer membrane protein assembly factor BamE [Francisella sp.]|jgi:outer membrane protein assembly factor BamE
MYKKILSACILPIAICSLNSCGLIDPYTAPVPQGKTIGNKKVFDIKPNMTKSEVVYMLGSPDIIDTFNPNQFIYVKTYKAHMQDTNYDESKLVLTFSNQDKLVGISGNYDPPTKDPVF